MAVMIAATVAAVWVAVGAVAGLAALGLYAAVTGYMAQAGTLIQWDEGAEQEEPHAD